MLRPVLIALLVPVALLGLIVAGRVSWVAYGPAPGADELTGQLRFLEGSLVRGDAERMQEQFPEGSYFLRARPARPRGERQCQRSDPGGGARCGRSVRLCPGSGESARVRSRWLGWIGLSVLPGTVLLVALLANGRRRSRMPH